MAYHSTVVVWKWYLLISWWKSKAIKRETCIPTYSLTGTNRLSQDHRANFMSPGTEECKRKEKQDIWAFLTKLTPSHLIYPWQRHLVTYQESPSTLDNASVKNRSFKPLIRQYYILKVAFIAMLLIMHLLFCIKKQKTQACNIKFQQYFTTVFKLIKCNWKMGATAI